MKKCACVGDYCEYSDIKLECLFMTDFEQQ